MAEFNPDEFIKKGESFDPDRFISGNSETPSEPGTLKSFAGGVAQGALFDPVTGINQLIEHATDNKIGLPDSVKNWLNDYKEKYTSGAAGKIGEGIGTIGSFFVPGGAIVKGAGAAGKGISALSKLGEAAQATRGAGGLFAKSASELAETAKAAKAAQKARGAGGLIPKAAERPPLGVKGKMAQGALYGGTGAAIQPVDEDQGDFGKQKAGQIAGGVLGGGALGLPGAGAGATSAAIASSVHEFGWPATIVGLSILTPTLKGLATHHQGWEAARHLSDIANAIVQRPGAAYAVGRGIGTVGGPAGAAVLDQTDNQ